MKKNTFFSLCFYLFIPFVYVNLTIFSGIWVYHVFPKIINGFMIMFVLPFVMYLVFYGLELALKERYLEERSGAFVVLLFFLGIAPIFFNALGFCDYWIARNAKQLVISSLEDVKNIEASEVAYLKLENSLLKKQSYGYQQSISTRTVSDQRLTTVHHDIVVPITIDREDTRIFAHEQFNDDNNAQILQDSFQTTGSTGAWIVHDPYILGRCHAAFVNFQKQQKTKIENPIFVHISQNSFAQDLSDRKKRFFLYLKIMNGITLLVVLYFLYPKKVAEEENQITFKD